MFMDWDADTKKGGSRPRIAMKKKLVIRGKWNKHAKIIEYTPLKWLRNVFLPMGENFQKMKAIWVRRMESWIQGISKTNLHWKLETHIEKLLKKRGVNFMQMLGIISSAYCPPSNIRKSHLQFWGAGKVES